MNALMYHLIRSIIYRRPNACTDIYKRTGKIARFSFRPSPCQFQIWSIFSTAARSNSNSWKIYIIRNIPLIIPIPYWVPFIIGYNDFWAYISLARFNLTGTMNIWVKINFTRFIIANPISKFRCIIYYLSIRNIWIICNKTKWIIK